MAMERHWPAGPAPWTPKAGVERQGSLLQLPRWELLRSAQTVVYIWLEEHVRQPHGPQLIRQTL